MTDVTIGQATAGHLSEAVHRSTLWTRDGLLERMFTLAFRGLVYAQIWEDPVIDMEALNLQPNDHVVTIASGGCNALSYLVGNPARVTALDLNGWHVALLKLKIAGAVHLPDYKTFFAFFGRADAKANLELYARFIKPNLDSETRQFWDSRDLLGRRRIELFTRNIYRHGLLGRCIQAAHWLGRIHGCKPSNMLAARSREEQVAIFQRDLAPVFEKPFAKAIFAMPASLYGLGIPPAQYVALTENGKLPISGVLVERVRRLACDFDLADNYFAQQAFGRRYGLGDDTSDMKTGLPPYLDEAHYTEMRARTNRVDVRHQSFTKFLGDSEAASADAYVLLDAQDWMTDDDLTALWTEITRTARPGARVIFRTAADERLLPGRIPDALLSQWSYDEAHCRDLHRRDRSSVYGGFHLYVKKLVP